MVSVGQRVMDWRALPDMVGTSDSSEPLLVEAIVPGRIELPMKELALDSLLARQVAVLFGAPPPSSAADCCPIEIPVQRSKCGRFHLCSFAAPRLQHHEKIHRHRQAPVESYQWLSADRSAVNMGLGVDKSYRMPGTVSHVNGERLAWYCIGARRPIAQLCAMVHYLGKRTSNGHGKVDGWSVSTVTPWDEGFPVVRDGKPTRPLPPEHPGLIGAKLRYRTLSYPYWDQSSEELCAVP